VEDILLEHDSRQVLAACSDTGHWQVTVALFLTLGKLEQSVWRWLDGSVAGQLVLQWQENSSPGVFELKSATAKGSSGCCETI